jgi:hypothetical protein
LKDSLFSRYFLFFFLAWAGLAIFFFYPFLFVLTSCVWFSNLTAYPEPGSFNYLSFWHYYASFYVFYLVLLISSF